MFENTEAFSGFAVNDLESSRDFYGQTLGIKVEEDEMGFLKLNLAGRNSVFVYPKSDHEPANYTILNFKVDDIDAAVDQLAEKGVSMEHYDDEEIATDEKGIMRGVENNKGPNIAWFKDPAGNTLSVIEN